MHPLNNTLSPKEVADLLGYINVHSVYQAVRRGNLPQPVKHRGLLGFRKKEIEKHLKGRKQ